jgi:hypothetical protein
MKNSNLTAIKVASLVLASSLSVSAETRALPTGSISPANAQITQIQENQKPPLNWIINFPPVLSELFNTVTHTTTIPVVAKVRVLGQGVTDDNGALVRTRGLMKIGNSGYKTVFDGTNNSVSANSIRLAKIFGPTYTNDIIPANTKIEFGGSYYDDYYRKWAQDYCSDSTGALAGNVKFLRDGDTPPAGLGVTNVGPTLESFLRPFLDSAGKVNIGPLDLIVFMELTHNSTQSMDSGYDFQDMLFLVTFSDPVTTTTTTTTPVSQ